jgi:hypothetical protein
MQQLYRHLGHMKLPIGLVCHPTRDVLIRLYDDWKASENKFKCTCHGSGYDSEGIKFEGPGAASDGSLQRSVSMAVGQVVVGRRTLFEWPKGEKKRV